MTRNIKSHDSKSLIPNFNEKCIDLYSTPFIEKMFDSEIIDEYESNNDDQDVNNCFIHKSYEINRSISYCVCLVLNNSYKDNGDNFVNNPPKIPYIHITDGYRELSRYDKINNQLRNKEQIIFQKKIDINGEDFYFELNEILKEKIKSITGYDYDAFTEKELNIKIFEEIFEYFQKQYKHCIDNKDITQSKVDEIEAIFERIKKVEDKYEVGKLFLDKIKTMNATSVIGTIEFLDEMSKYNLSYHGCSFRKNKYSYGNHIKIYGSYLHNIDDIKYLYIKTKGQTNNLIKFFNELKDNSVSKFLNGLPGDQSRDQSGYNSIGKFGGKSSRKKSRKIKNRIVKKHRKTRNKRGNVFKKRFRFKKKNRKQSRLT